jgi:hypothetical protein
VIHRARVAMIDPKPVASKQQVSNAELISHYVSASKGDPIRSFLMALNAGYDFKRVVLAMGDNGVRISFNCILEGLVSEGRITEQGRKYLRTGSDS